MNQPIRKKLTREEGFSLVERFLQSNLKPIPFCAQERIAPHIFRYWQRARKYEAEQMPKTFLPVKIITSTQQVEPKNNIKVIFSPNLLLEVPPGANMESFKQILEVCHYVVNR